MIRSLHSCSSSSVLPTDVRNRRAIYVPPAGSATAICCAARRDDRIPKLEPFTRSKLDRVVKEPHLIQKCEHDLSDYCSTLEGDDSYSCWKAYFELKDLEKETPKEDIVRLILEAGGLKSLIGFLHGIAAIHKAKKVMDESNEGAKAMTARTKAEGGGQRPFPVPDGLPKTAAELEEEESARMPDSAHTRLLRTKGRFPAWYSPVPDHETD